MTTIPSIPLCLLGVMVNRMQLSIVLSFQLLWVTSFIDETISDEDQAKAVYVYLNLIGGLLTFATFYFIGKAADNYSPKILTPICFAARAITLMGIFLVSNPASLLSYLVWSLMAVAALFQSIVVDAYFAKIIPKEVRGVLIALNMFMGLVGKGFIIKLGGMLFDVKGPDAPFALIAGFDMAFCIFITGMILA
eukprot:CAMPEP_0202979848 /NCGR_PEP_ID=MMETSP1396-20130829/85889_1 /ASSEMBLY_ACC=CAM_ASM_000872 /TAXON_ID= /ORGANISM="Pseudokeronopsis sp., Strain Brazil" /LENGTH=192 /DNA_ID=CAMNT_0049719465 /DNA_START=506 /DNA_END=1081 /DNA_ORIENTATION=+